MNIYLNSSLPHDLNKCHICKMSTAIIPVTNVYSWLQENQVNSEHTVGLTTQNHINTVGMAVETCYHGLVSTSFTPSQPLHLSFHPSPPSFLLAHWPSFYFQYTQSWFPPQELIVLLAWNFHLSIHSLGLCSKAHSLGKSAMITPPNNAPTPSSTPCLQSPLHYLVYFLCCASFSGNYTILFFICISSVFSLA